MHDIQSLTSREDDFLTDFATLVKLSGMHEYANAIATINV